MLSVGASTTQEKCQGQPEEAGQEPRSFSSLERVDQELQYFDGQHCGDQWAPGCAERGAAHGLTSGTSSERNFSGN